MLEIKNILHPTDFSVPADAAFQLACLLARDHGARLSILHVAPPPAYFTGEGMITPLPPTDFEELKSQLNHIKPTDREISLQHLLTEGDPVTQILSAASDMQCDMIVMGTHGRTGLGRLLLGSVAEEVVRKAPCAVVTIKSPLVQHSEAMGSDHESKAVATSERSY